MSKIDIVITKAPQLAKTLAVLRRVSPQESVAELSRRVEVGSPVVEYVLFENDHLDVADRLRFLLRELPATGAAIRIFELRDNELFDANANLSAWEISGDTLSNILSETETRQ